MDQSEIIFQLNQLTDRLRLNRRFRNSSSQVSKRTQKRIKELEQKIKALREQLNRVTN